MSVFGLNLRRIWVKKKRFGDEQIIGVSKRAQARAPVAEVIGRRGSASIRSAAGRLVQTFIRC
jgi:hypothetical protein